MGFVEAGPLIFDSQNIPKSFEPGQAPLKSTFGINVSEVQEAYMSAPPDQRERARIQFQERHSEIHHLAKQISEGLVRSPLFKPFFVEQCRGRLKLTVVILFTWIASNIHGMRSPCWL
jgi:hypothetical protein